MITKFRVIFVIVVVLGIASLGTINENIRFAKQIEVDNNLCQGEWSCRCQSLCANRYNHSDYKSWIYKRSLTQSECWCIESNESIRVF